VKHSRIRDVMRLLGMGGVLLVCGGCLSLSASYPEKHWYVLDVVRSEAPHTLPAQNGLTVTKLRISPAFQGKSFVYRIDDVRYEADFYHEWFTAPNAMLTQQVLNWLTAAGLFHYVVEDSGLLKATYRLDGNVTALYGDFRETSPQAVLGIQFFLVRENTTSQDIMWHGTYREKVNVRGNSPAELVRGWNEALRRILTALDGDLMKNARNQ
jgi:cholesterol transport system auxiliary component